MAGRNLEIPTPRVFRPLLDPARYKGCWGGRGSGKSHQFASMAVESCLLQRGTRGLCVREVQKSLKESAKRLIEDKIDAYKIQSSFNVLATEIKTPGGGLISFIGMQDHTAESVMSFEGLDWVWVEQAETLSARSLQVLRPTIRKETSELWFSWNPRRKSDPVDAFLRGEHPPPGAVVLRANWSDNPFFPPTLEAERQHDLKHSPSYRHVWEGDYATVVEGAYYANALAQAAQEGRITDLAYDPLLERRAYWDIGIDDAMAIWVTQRKGQRLYAMDYIEGMGQGLDYYVTELRRRGHADAECVLPHDGANRSVVTGKRFSEHLKEAGFRVRIVRNAGAGAAMMRIEASRRIFPRVWFNDSPTQAGREALGSYHERKDDRRDIGLGPEHDWASHSSDSFGLCCIDYEEPRATIKTPEREVYRAMGDEANSAWMGS